MSPEDFGRQPEAERERITQVIAGLRERLDQLSREVPRLRREMQQRIREATRDALGLAAGHLIDELKDSFAAHPKVLAFLDETLAEEKATDEKLTGMAEGGANAAAEAAQPA